MLEGRKTFWKHNQIYQNGSEVKFRQYVQYVYWWQAHGCLSYLNLLYDLSQTAIPLDNIDKVYINVLKSNLNILYIHSQHHIHMNTIILSLSLSLSHSVYTKPLCIVMQENISNNHMICIGPISSIFHISTFLFMWFYFDVRSDAPTCKI